MNTKERKDKMPGSIQRSNEKEAKCKMAEREEGMRMRSNWKRGEEGEIEKWQGKAEGND